jgi:hypothetical protein
MALPNIYTQTYGQIAEFLSKLQEGQAPSKFTQQHLKDIGYASTNHRAFIPLLKAIGFLSPDGSPTSRYHAYRDKSQARNVLGEALKEVYTDLFVIKAQPTDKDKALIEGKFKSAHNASDRSAELMAKTFFSLLKLADVSHSETKLAKASVETKEVSQEEEHLVVEPQLQSQPQKHLTTTGLHYNIQIHLPATKDVEVYNAIFKSLKEHLVG